MHFQMIEIISPAKHYVHNAKPLTQLVAIYHNKMHLYKGALSVGREHEFHVLREKRRKTVADGKEEALEKTGNSLTRVCSSAPPR